MYIIVLQCSQQEVLGKIVCSMWGTNSQPPDYDNDDLLSEWKQQTNGSYYYVILFLLLPQQNKIFLTSYYHSIDTLGTYCKYPSSFAIIICNDNR